MSGDTGFSVALLALMLILPLSSLLARRLPFGAIARMALAWLAIFIAGLLIVTAAGRHGISLDRVSDELGLSNQRTTGTSTRIQRGPDGHFTAIVSINGHPQRMVIGTGATSTAISSQMATIAGVVVDDRIGTIVDTANGSMTARRATVASMSIGTIKARDLGVIVAPSFGDGLIGMNFLSRLKSWRVEGDEMVLEPYPDR